MIPTHLDNIKISVKIKKFITTQKKETKNLKFSSKLRKQKLLVTLDVNEVVDVVVRLLRVGLLSVDGDKNCQVSESF
jgi:hypothetical protein